MNLFKAACCDTNELTVSLFSTPGGGLALSCMNKLLVYTALSGSIHLFSNLFYETYMSYTPFESVITFLDEH